MYTAFWRHCETTRLQDPERNSAEDKLQAPLISDPLAKRLVAELLPQVDWIIRKRAREKPH